MKKREFLFLAGGIIVGSIIAKKMCLLSVENLLLREMLAIKMPVK